MMLVSIDRSTNEFITAAVNRKNETRLLGIWFQLLPEVDDVRVDCARVGIVFITPDRIQKPIARERFRGMGDKVGEQRKLFRREIDCGARAGGLSVQRCRGQHPQQ